MLIGLIVDPYAAPGDQAPVDLGVGVVKERRPLLDESGEQRALPLPVPIRCGDVVRYQVVAGVDPGADRFLRLSRQS